MTAARGWQSWSCVYQNLLSLQLSNALLLQDNSPALSLQLTNA